MDAGTPPIRAFLSYSHADDEEFDIVEPLVKKLKAYVRAKSGRKLEVFVDRDSIGWGSDWRQSISSSVENATVFIPLLSANYLDSDACREEFLAFHSKAEVLGVTELLLPILIFSSPLFSEGATDEIAAIAEALQYKVIEGAVVSGFQSPEWLQCTRDLAESLLQALATAEQSLIAAASDQSVVARAAENADTAALAADVEESGLAEVMQELATAAERMTAAVEPLTPALESLGEVPGAVGDLPDDPTPRQVTAWTLRLAHEFRAPAKAIEMGGKELFDATKSFDKALLKLKQLTDSVEVPEFTQSLTEGRRNLITSFGDLHEVAETMESLLESIKPAELLSVPLRKAIQPARRGLTAVRDSLKMIESWQQEFRD